MLASKMNQQELINAKLSGYYIDSNNGQRGTNSTNKPYNVSSENISKKIGIHIHN